MDEETIMSRLFGSSTTMPNATSVYGSFGHVVYRRELQSTLVLLLLKSTLPPVLLLRGMKPPL